MPNQDATPSRLNISRWALEHPALTRYLMVVLLVLGFAAYFQLGQDEDPPFTFRAMVVQAFWPGATAEQMAEQVTSKIERALQEVPYADVQRSYTKPGESLTILQLKDSSPPKAVANTWYQVRKRVGDMRSTLPAGVIGPVFNDESCADCHRGGGDSNRTVTRFGRLERDGFDALERFGGSLVQARGIGRSVFGIAWTIGQSLGVALSGAGIAAFGFAPTIALAGVGFAALGVWMRFNLHRLP